MVNFRKAEFRSPAIGWKRKRHSNWSD